MEDFNLAIFRVAELPESSKINQLVQEERYIGLVPGTHYAKSSWYISDTLFGLQRQMNPLDFALDWEQVEKELNSKGFFKVLPQLSREERESMEQARK